MLDTQLGDNDGAPFQIPGMGNVTTEKEFLGEEIPPIWLSMNDLAYPTVISKGILLGLGATKPDRFVLARWLEIRSTDWDYQIIPYRYVTGDSAVGIWWNPQAIEAGQERRIITYYGVGSAKVSQVVWEANIPYSLSASGQPSVEMTIPQEIRGKFMLTGKLFSSSKQLIAENTESFYIIPPDMALLFKPEKKFYRPGETVQIEGDVRNQTSIEAANLTLEIKEETLNGLTRTLYQDTFSLPAGEKYHFGFSKIAGGEGTAILVGEVRQNDSQWVEIMDQYVVALPKLLAGITAPDSVGQDLFLIKVEVKNEGKVGAKTHVEIVDDLGQKIEAKELTLLAGETRFLQYSQQVAKNTWYDFRFTGDLEKSESKTVYFDFGGYVDFYPSPFYPEGKVGLPAVVENPSGFYGIFEVHFQLNPGSPEQVKTYYLSPYSSIPDILYFNLPAGDYQITATSPVPIYSEPKGFKVRKENKVELGLALGPQAGGVVPVNVSLKNLGYNEVSGGVSVSVSESGKNAPIWNAKQDILPLSAEATETLTFQINPSAFDAGSYIVSGELLNPAGETLANSSSPLTVVGSLFRVTGVPSFKSFLPGEEAAFSFKVKNVGNQEGEFGFHLRSLDQMDMIRREWVKPGEEKTLDFTFPLPRDLEEKDYFADYEILGTEIRGQVKYHLSGINLQVNASLNKEVYQEGETGTLTINVFTPSPSVLNLFARVNYPGYESKEDFVLNGSQVLTFYVPFPKISGEKLFYGIYHEGGRSFHLNSLYIHKAGDILSVKTDKQVYKPGETVSVAVSGSVSGNVTLSGPGGYSEVFPFAAAAGKSFILPSSMTAGTYYVSYQISTIGGQNYSGNHPFDVAGIQVKVKEAILDKAQYASSDTIKLSLNIESNQNLSATLKTWIVDPEKNYNQTGTYDITLTNTESLLTTQSFAFQTTKLGLHRLVYGIYSGDLLLCSGAEAFDMGGAVILGVSTDKADYPTGQEPIVATASLLGSVPANLELFVDGQSMLSQPVALGGFSTAPYSIPSVGPGRHSLKAVLTSGGLTSTKEAAFLYGTNLPDLVAWIYSDQLVQDGDMKFKIIVKNQGKSPSVPTRVYLYDGLGSSQETLAIVDINALAPGESQEFFYSYNCLGKTGGHTLSGRIEPLGTSPEFNQGNNEAQIAVTVPSLVLNTTLDKESYSPGETIPIKGAITNLSPAPTAGLKLKTTVKDAADLPVFVSSKDIPSIPGKEKTIAEIPWPTDPGLAEGSYSLYQVI
ncbi:MAG: hypothetical protein NTY64_22565, partial [Deltaproteobacteria bacterium]|nr:hypothetical protein [Deltaproteobacteria bacterium]